MIYAKKDMPPGYQAIAVHWDADGRAIVWSLVGPNGFIGRYFSERSARNCAWKHKERALDAAMANTIMPKIDSEEK